MTTIAPPTTPTDGRPAPRRARGRGRVSWAVIAVTSLAIAGYFVGQYGQGSLSDLAGRHVGLAETYANRPWPITIAFYAHIVFSGLALAIGPFQFSTRLRRRYPAGHRWVGRAYLVSVALGGVAALVMSFVSSVGLLGFFGFGTLAVLWMWTGWKGYTAIRAGNVGLHRSWMMRNFALTYAAVMLRTWLGVLLIAQIPFITGADGFQNAFDNAYAVVPFWCWLPNLVVVEWLIRRRGLPSFRLTPGATPITAP